MHPCSLLRYIDPQNQRSRSLGYAKVAAILIAGVYKATVGNSDSDRWDIEMASGEKTIGSMHGFTKSPNTQRF